MNDERLDRRISDLVRSVTLEAPREREEVAIEAARSAGASMAARKAARRPLGLRLWAALAPAAVLAGLIALLALPPLKTSAPAPAAPIAEIRTELELAGKNIKVIFFQKPDFNLFKETNHE